MTRSSTKELLTPFKDLEREFQSSRKLFKTLSLNESRSPEYNLFSYLEENSKEEVTETMAETMEQYMSKTRADYGSGIARTKIDDKDHFVLKGQFLKELRDNTFSGLDHEDANEHIEKVREIVDLFNVPNITQDQVMLQVFPIKYCPPVRTAKKMEEINNFHQEPDETLYQAWERFKELLKKFPQHYLTKMKEVILFYNGLDVPTRQILDSKAQLNNLGREMKKVNEKVYAAQVEGIMSIVEADMTPIRRIGSSQYAVWAQQNSKLMFESRLATIPFPSRLNNYYCDENKGSYGLQCLYAYSYGAIRDNDSLPRKENDLGNFIILDMPEDIKVPLILGRPFLSTARFKIYVFKRKITLRVGEEKITFKSVKPTSSLIKRVYMILQFLDDMDAYRDDGIGDVIFGEPFLREVRINAKLFEGIITTHNGIGNQSIECDHLNEIGMVENLVEFLSFTFGDKEMIL
ncbi:gag-pol polyprotein, partial [Tanacetum coccineum]